jgi:cation transport ATPase
MSNYTKCAWCGTMVEKNIMNKFISNNTYGLAGKQKNTFCSIKCEREYASSNAIIENDSYNSKSQSNDYAPQVIVQESKSVEQINAEIEKMKVEAELKRLEAEKEREEERKEEQKEQEKLERDKAKSKQLKSEGKFWLSIWYLIGEKGRMGAGLGLGLSIVGTFQLFSQDEIGWGLLTTLFSLIGLILGGLIIKDALK